MNHDFDLIDLRSTIEAHAFQLEQYRELSSFLSCFDFIFEASIRYIEINFTTFDERCLVELQALISKLNSENARL